MKAKVRFKGRVYSLTAIDWLQNGNLFSVSILDDHGNKDIIYHDENTKNEVDAGGFKYTNLNNSIIVED